jgi:rRNA small subunit pseudouridine methyltransferase Nep1
MENASDSKNVTEIVPDGSHEGNDDEKARVIVLLDLANIETVKTKNGDFQLMNCDDHVSIMKKTNKDPARYRPDILHQELMAVLDSPLNKAGKVTLYFHTEKNVLVEISPLCRIPRTFKRFSGLIVQLLHRLKIRSSDGNETLLKVIKNPMSRHLPPGIRCYGLSQSGTLYTPMNFIRSIPEDEPIMFVIGAMANGSIKKDDHPYMTDVISISEYPLSGVVAINRLLGAIESHWGIV